jgi:hypothetical protein
MQVRANFTTRHPKIHQYRGDQIFATSYVGRGEWWDEESLSVNLLAAQKGVIIQRIFIFANSAELQESYTSDIIKKQIEAKNIELKGLPKNRIFYKVKDIIIFHYKKTGQKIAGEMLLTPDRRAEETILYKGKDADEIKKLWDVYNENPECKPLQEYLEEGKNGKKN